MGTNLPQKVERESPAVDSIPQNSGIPPLAFALGVAVFVAVFALVPYLLWGMTLVYVAWGVILAFFFFSLGYRVGGGRLPL
jgi:VIT1/CCC1 family predicted Fe2+/Mn2+ transporter